jgi:hypothetical protein
MGYFVSFFRSPLVASTGQCGTEPEEFVRRRKWKKEEPPGDSCWEQGFRQTFHMDPVDHRNSQQLLAASRIVRRGTGNFHFVGRVQTESLAFVILAILMLVPSLEHEQDSSKI